MTDEKDYTLYLSSLPDKITEKLLMELFSQAGPVDNVSLKKGFGFITFAHHISIPYTMKLFEGLKLFGRQIVMKPRDGSIYANQFNQRRPGNHTGNRDHSTPSTSFNARQPKMQMESRNVTPLLGGGGGAPNLNQQWGFNSSPGAGFQLQRPNSVTQMGFSGNSDNRNDRNLPHGGFREQQGRNSFDGGKFSGFRGRDQTNGRQNDAGSGSKSFRGNNQPHWSDAGASKSLSLPHSGQGNSFGRRDSQGDRGRYNDRQGSGFGSGSGEFRSHDWNRANRTSFGGSSEGSSFDRSGGRNRRDSHFSSQRNDRSGGGGGGGGGSGGGSGGHRPHHGDKPYNRQQGNRFSHESFSKNDFNRFGSGGRRP